MDETEFGQLPIYNASMVIQSENCNSQLFSHFAVSFPICRFWPNARIMKLWIPQKKRNLPKTLTKPQGLIYFEWMTRVKHSALWPLRLGRHWFSSLRSRIDLGHCDMWTASWLAKIFPTSRVWLSLPAARGPGDFGGSGETVKVTWKKTAEFLACQQGCESHRFRWCQTCGKKILVKWLHDWSENEVHFLFFEMNCIKIFVVSQDPFEWLPRDMLINRGRSSARFVKDAVQAVVAIMCPEASESFNDLQHHSKKKT